MLRPGNNNTDNSNCYNNTSHAVTLNNGRGNYSVDNHIHKHNNTAGDNIRIV